MSFKEFSSAHGPLSKVKPVAKPKVAAAVEQPATQRGEKPVGAEPAHKP